MCVLYVWDKTSIKNKHSKLKSHMKAEMMHYDIPAECLACEIWHVSLCRGDAWSSVARHMSSDVRISDML